MAHLNEKYELTIKRMFLKASITVIQSTTSYSRGLRKRSANVTQRLRRRRT